MPKFRKKPVVIEAIQLTWENWSDICDFAGVGRLEDGKPQETDADEANNTFPNGGPGLAIPTSEGLHLAKPNDWIIKGIQGNLCPCKPDIFEKTYEPVED